LANVPAPSTALSVLMPGICATDSFNLETAVGDRSPARPQRGMAPGWSERNPCSLHGLNEAQARPARTAADRSAGWAAHRSGQGVHSSKTPRLKGSIAGPAHPATHCRF
jgi:hypothetical protein